MTLTLADKKAKFNTVMTTYFKDLNDPKISTAIINNVVDWECVVRLGNSMVQGALSAIPTFGPAIAAVVDFLVSFILAAVTNSADPLAPYKKLLKKALTEYEQATLKAEFKGLSDSLELLTKAVETASSDNTEANRNAAFTQFVATNTVVTDRIPNLCKDGYEVVGFPYYHKVVTFHLLMLMDVVINPLYNISDAKKLEYTQLLESKKIEYFTTLNSTFNKGITKLVQDHDLPDNFLDKVGDSASFEMFNSIMSYRNDTIRDTFDSMYPLIFLDPKFKAGMYIYNPRVMFGRLCGQPLNALATPSSVNQMLNLLKTQDAYSYNGDLKGVDLYISTSDNFQFNQSIQNQYMKNNILPRVGKQMGKAGLGTVNSITGLSNVTSIELAYMWRSLPTVISGAGLNVQLKGIKINDTTIGVTDSIAFKSEPYTYPNHKLQGIYAFQNIMAKTIGDNRDYSLGLDAVIPTWIPSDTTDITYLKDKVATVVSPKRYFMKDAATVNKDGALIGFDTLQLKLNDQIFYKVTPENKSVLSYKVYLKVKASEAVTLKFFETITEKKTFTIASNANPQTLEGPVVTVPADDYFSFYYNLQITSGSTLELQGLIFVPQTA